MALIRILVDGYSLLHGWPELARGSPRHSAAARDELLKRLRLYRDAVGTPITVFFDGNGKVPRGAAAGSSSELEVLYSGAGKTADDLIERATHRFAAYGEVLVVTDDRAERDTVMSLGGLSSSCGSFIDTLENALTELSDDIQHHNRQERHRFKTQR